MQYRLHSNAKRLKIRNALAKHDERLYQAKPEREEAAARMSSRWSPPGRAFLPTERSAAQITTAGETIVEPLISHGKRSAPQLSSLRTSRTATQYACTAYCTHKCLLLRCLDLQAPVVSSIILSPLAPTQTPIEAELPKTSRRSSTTRTPPLCRKA